MLGNAEVYSVESLFYSPFWVVHWLCMEPMGFVQSNFFNLWFQEFPGFCFGAVVGGFFVCLDDSAQISKSESHTADDFVVLLAFGVGFVVVLWGKILE